MGTDKELIELAARAVELPECGWMGSAFMYVKDNTFTDWNPLEDDGDALRLAVKLGLDVCIDTPHERRPYTQAIGFRNTTTAETVNVIENHGDPYVATRRAIVLVAAKLGAGRAKAA